MKILPNKSLFLVSFKALLSASADQTGGGAAHVALPDVALQAPERLVERLSGQCAQIGALDTLFVINLKMAEDR